MKDTNKKETEPLFARFHGEGGYSCEQKRAQEIFIKDHEYEVVGGQMGQSRTDIELKGIQGSWNSALFAVDIDHPIIHNPYAEKPETEEQLARRTLPEGWLWFGRGPLKVEAWKQQERNVTAFNTKNKCWDFKYGYSGNSSSLFYALRRGSKIHRAQAWFDESQVNVSQKEEKSDTSTEPVAQENISEWREMGPDEILEKGDEIYIESNNRWYTVCGLSGKAVSNIVSKKARTRRPLPVPSGIEAQVCADIAKRQQLGIKKYGTTLADSGLSLKQYLQHAYEESLDKCMYLKAAILKIEEEEK